MNYKKYFEKNGFVYGVSVRFNFGLFIGYAIKFTNLENAEKWLDKEEYDFREKMLVSKSALKNYTVKFISENDIFYN